jgi:hypothetical protein
MSGKLNFGCDYLQIILEVFNRGDTDSLDLLSYEVARLFLLDWGFSFEEINQVANIYVEKLKKETLGDLSDTVSRLVAFANKDRAMQERLVIEVAAIGYLDFEVTDDEDDFIHIFQDQFDFKPSEFKALTAKGSEIAGVLNSFGERYKKQKADAEKS